MKKTTRLLMSGVAAIVIAASAVTVLTPPAFAQSGNGQGQGGQNQDAGSSQGNKGSQGQGGQNQGGNGGPNADAGGEEEEDSDRRGPQYGQPGDDEDRGGRPEWGGEDYPEVELGRLSVAKSPEKVLDRAFDEVIANFDPAVSAEYYEMSATEFASEAETNWDALTIVDSPLQNLALLREIWTTGDTSLPGVDIEDTSVIDLSAILIGVASDKELSISEDTIRALSVIFDADLSDAEIAAIAAKAEDVRESVAIGHG